MKSAKFFLRHILVWVENIINQCTPISIKEKRIEKKLKKEILFFDCKDVKEVIYQQYLNGNCSRMDVFVRLLAIENEFGMNDYGWELYRKMQQARSGENKKRINERVKRFKKLIKSANNNGYIGQSNILVDRNMHLRDGAHRLALAIFFDWDKINCGIIAEDVEVNYGLEWFKNNNFTEKEIGDILIKSEMYL